jgi:hypothetical protein
MILDLKLFLVQGYTMNTTSSSTINTSVPQRIVEESDYRTDEISMTMDIPQYDFSMPRWTMFFVLLSLIWDLATDAIPDVLVGLPKDIKSFLEDFKNYTDDVDTPHNYRLRDVKCIVSSLFNCDDITRIMRRVEEVSFCKGVSHYNETDFTNYLNTGFQIAKIAKEDEWDNIHGDIFHF